MSEDPEMEAFYERQDHTTQDPEWVFDLLRLFAWDECDQLWWTSHGDGEELVFNVDCSDTFGWACADAEKVTVEDLAGLRRAKADLPEGDWPLLWICRKRGMRPMNVFMERVVKDPRERELFEAAGPPRESHWTAP